MRTYIVKRLLLMIPTLLAITLISYTIMRIAPGKPVMLREGGPEGGMKPGQMTPESRRLMKEAWHLDENVFVGYLYWLKDICTGNFGVSFTKKIPVSKMLREAIPVTIRLNLLAMLISYLVAVPIGIWSSTRRGRTSDKFVTLGLFALYSIPSFWLALLLLWILGKGGVLGLLPLSGLTPAGAASMTFIEYLWAATPYYILPVFCLTYASLASLSRYARVGMMEVLQQDYIRTARAKGLSERLVIYRHAFRNSLIPLLTIIGMEIPALIGGSMIIETIFTIPGMGRMGFIALQDRDYNTLMAVFTIAAVLTMIGLLISDLLYAVADPRIDLEKRVQ